MHNWQQRGTVNDWWQVQQQQRRQQRRRRERQASAAERFNDGGVLQTVGVEWHVRTIAFVLVCEGLSLECVLAVVATMCLKSFECV